jgi:LacI family gluconate utilization system Gnt-I transcriptional repressor
MRKRRGSDRPTLADVAAAAGVSAITASRYFNDAAQVSPERRARIAAAVEALGYVPNMMAGGLASAQSRVVAMVVPNISGPIFAGTMQALSDGLARENFQLLLASSYFSQDNEERAVRAFLGWSPAALVLTSRFHSAGTEAMLERLAQPVVETWDLDPTRRPLQVGFSHHQVGRDAATYLADRGYERIAFVHNVVPDMSARHRCAGYAEVMTERGLKAVDYQPTAATPMDGGALALQAFTAKGTRRRADALFFANDNLAFGAVLAAQRLGVRVPQDIALFGFGDYAMADKLLPSLSTIRPPAQAIGEVAARHILQLVGGGPDARAAVPHATELACELVARESA